MKVIDADELKAEIERLEHENCMNGGEHFCMRRAICLGNLRNIITSPYHEHPEVDIEKEINELWESLNTGHDYVIVDSYQCFLGICLHCFELGLNARKEDKQ